jgi:hypothetical protein
MRKLLLIPAVGVLAMLSMAAAAGVNLEGNTTGGPVVAQEGSATGLSCDSNVQVYFNNNWDSGADHFEVATVTVAGISGNCVGSGHTVKVQLTHDGDEIGPTLGNTHTADVNEVFDFSSYNIPTLDVNDVHVVIQ